MSPDTGRRSGDASVGLVRHAQAVLQCERSHADLHAQDTWRLRVVRSLERHPGQLWTSPSWLASHSSEQG